MARYRITGIDRDSGFQTSIMIEAPDQDAAEREALTLGVAARDVEQVSPHLESIGYERLHEAVATYRTAPSGTPPATGSLPVLPQEAAKRLWLQVAAGVCVGLMLYSLIAVCASYATWRWFTSRGGPAPANAVSVPVAQPPIVGHFKATDVEWRFQETFVEFTWSATVISEYDRPWRCTPIFIFRYETGEKLGEQAGEPLTILPGKTQVSGRIFVTADAFNISTEKDIIFRP